MSTFRLNRQFFNIWVLLHQIIYRPKYPKVIGYGKGQNFGIQEDERYFTNNLIYLTPYKPYGGSVDDHPPEYFYHTRYQWFAASDSLRKIPALFLKYHQPYELTSEVLLDWLQPIIALWNAFDGLLHLGVGLLGCAVWLMLCLANVVVPLSCFTTMPLFTRYETYAVLRCLACWVKYGVSQLLYSPFQLIMGVFNWPLGILYRLLITTAFRHANPVRTIEQTPHVQECLATIDSQAPQIVSYIEAFDPNHNQSLSVLVSLRESIQNRKDTVNRTVAPGEKLCPLSLQPIKDPVLASDGYHYERAVLSRYVSYSPPTTSLMTGDIWTQSDRDQCSRSSPLAFNEWEIKHPKQEMALTVLMLHMTSVESHAKAFKGKTTLYGMMCLIESLHRHYLAQSRVGRSSTIPKQKESVQYESCYRAYDQATPERKHLLLGRLGFAYQSGFPRFGCWQQRGNFRDSFFKIRADQTKKTDSIAFFNSARDYVQLYDTRALSQLDFTDGSEGTYQTYRDSTWGSNQ